MFSTCGANIPANKRALRVWQPFPRLSWTAAAERPRHHCGTVTTTLARHRVNILVAAHRAHPAFAATLLVQWAPPRPWQASRSEPRPRRQVHPNVRCANTPDCVTTTDPYRTAGADTLRATTNRNAARRAHKKTPKRPRTGTSPTPETTRPRRRTGPSTAGARHEKKHRRRRQGPTPTRNRKDPNRRDDAPAAEPHLLPGFFGFGFRFG